MEPLLEIKTIPMSFEMKINRARLELATTDATFEVSRERAAFKCR
jgi:hypothetical protein